MSEYGLYDAWLGGDITNWLMLVIPIHCNNPTAAMPLHSHPRVSISYNPVVKKNKENPLLLKGAVHKTLSSFIEKQHTVGPVFALRALFTLTLVGVLLPANSIRAMLAFPQPVSD